jgi:hypothetical protein
LGHKQTSAASFDHLVGDSKYSRGDCKAERLRSFQVDAQLKFSWLYDRSFQP